MSSESFTLSRGLSPVELENYANVNNSWIGYDGELVNEETGKSYPLVSTVEQYSGAGWTEGSTLSKKCAHPRRW
jgi:hypothetical protein